MLHFYWDNIYFFKYQKVTMEPLFKIAVRNDDGTTALFGLQHEDVSTLTHAFEATKQGIPSAKAILISIPKEILNAGRQVINGTTG